MSPSPDATRRATQEPPIATSTHVHDAGASNVPGTRLPRLRQSSDDRILTGVAAGFGERFGVEPILVRIAVVVLATAAGFGAIVYWLLWATSLAPDEQPDRPTTKLAPSLHQDAAFALLVLGLLFALRGIGFWISGALTWPVSLAAAGSAVLWARGDDASRQRWSRTLTRIPGDPAGALVGVSRERALIGGALVSLGFVLFLANNASIGLILPVLLALAVLILGGLFLLGPWVMRLMDQLGTERRERIREEERSAVAAHLHDSVLQTLALMQRTNDPGEIAALARRQERELRQWLYGGRDLGGPVQLSVAIDTIVDDVEAQHGVVVDTVVVGDTPVDGHLREVLAACREALVNAARHAGEREIAWYIEVTPGSVLATVRDRGRGFDTSAVPVDRRGIADSIRGRVARLGGTVQITSAPGEGTEVDIDVPRPKARPEGNGA